MKFNALQKYLLKVYAITIIFLTIFVPTYASDSASFGFILFGYTSAVNVAFLLTEYLAVTLALIACILACYDSNRK